MGSKQIRVETNKQDTFLGELGSIAQSRGLGRPDLIARALRYVTRKMTDENFLICLLTCGQVPSEENYTEDQ